jgi:hypothetical protein
MNTAMRAVIQDADRRTAEIQRLLATRHTDDTDDARAIRRMLESELAAIARHVVSEYYWCYIYRPAA